MKLKETIPMMESENYMERFKAEYYQLIIRYSRLNQILAEWDLGELDFSPACPRSTYQLQMNAMTDYIAVLEARAAIEGIDLKDIDMWGDSHE